MSPGLGLRQREVAAQPTPARPAPYTPGPEMTPGTTAAAMANLGPQGPQAAQPARARVAAPTPGQTPSEPPHQPPTMEDRMASPAPAMRAQYPPLPAGAQPKPVAKRPSAVVNKEAVARVQATQAAMKAKSANASTGMSAQDMQNVGEGLGDALRTFRQAVADVRGSVDPEMRTIQAEIDAAQKELEQSIEAAKQPPPPTKTLRIIRHPEVPDVTVLRDPIPPSRLSSLSLCYVLRHVDRLLFRCPPWISGEGLGSSC